MPLLLTAVARLPLDAPVLLGRDEAQRLARLELAKPEYTREQEPWVTRVVNWLLQRIGDLLDTVSGTSPLGWFGILGVVALLVLVVIAVRRRTGPLSRAGGAPLFEPGARAASDHRREAERMAAAGAWAEALRERLRAVVREVEERGLIDVAPGRTADEIARDAGMALPSAAGDLTAGARLFDDVWYGGRTADAAAYARMVAVDDAVRAARAGDGRGHQDRPLAVPR